MAQAAMAAADQPRLSPLAGIVGNLSLRPPADVGRIARNAITHQRRDMQIALLLYDGFTALDIIGPYDVLRNMPGSEPVFVAEQAGPVRDESKTLGLVADRSLSEVPTPDIVVVPGGFGTRRLLERRPLLSWIRTAHESSRWTTAVCTGSLLLAAAGLLEGV